MNWLFDLFGTYMIPTMLAVFCVAIVLRMVTYYIVHSEKLFVNVFTANVKKYMNGDFDDAKGLNFYKLIEYLLNRSQFEYFDLRRRFTRRRGDMAMNLLDRLFLFELGTSVLIEDTLNQTKYHHKGNPPEFDHVAKQVYNSNPYYNKFIGVVPIQMVDDLVNVLPGLFIVGGILGTFIGIMTGIPELKAIDVTNTDDTQKALEGFLNAMAYAMTSSVIGISLSVLMTITNTAFSCHVKFVNLVDDFKDDLKFVWNESMLHAKEQNKDKIDAAYNVDYFKDQFNKKAA